MGNGLVSAIPDRLPASHIPEDPGKGCTESHRRAVQEASDAKRPWVLVLEDDARWNRTALNQYGWDGLVMAKMIEDALELSRGKSCIMFLGAGTISQSGRHVQWKRRYGDGVYLGSISHPNAVVTATHAVLYIAGKGTDYTDILECLEDKDGWSHTDMTISANFAGKGRRLFITAPFLVHFEDRVETSDVRVGKTTENDYEKLIATENLLLKLAQNTRSLYSSLTATLDTLPPRNSDAFQDSANCGDKNV